MRVVALVALCALAGLSACGGDGMEGGESPAVGESAFTDDIGVISPDARRPLPPGQMASSCTFPSDCNTGVCLTSKFYKDFTQGYCSNFCNPSAMLSCGLHATCVSAGVNICVRACAADNDCYGGQRCIGMMCVPKSVVMDMPASQLIRDDDVTLTRIAKAMSIGKAIGNVMFLSGGGLLGVPFPGQTSNAVGDGLNPGHSPIDDGSNPHAMPIGSPGNHLDIVIQSRAVGSPGHELARAWLVGQLRGLNLQVSEQEFLRMPGPAGAETGGVMLKHKIVNVRALLSGTEPHLAPVVVLAHYDSRATRSELYIPTTDPAPGAGDNAVGVAAVLEIARILANEVGQPRRSIEFLFVDAAAQGWSGTLFDANTGSKAYVRSLGLGEAPYCALNLDGIAWKSAADPNHVWIGLDSRYGLASQLVVEAVRDHLPDFQMVTTTNDAFFALSDQRSFTAEGLCSAYVSSYPTSSKAGTEFDTTTAAVDWQKFINATRASALIVGAWANWKFPPIIPWSE